MKNLLQVAMLVCVVCVMGCQDESPLTQDQVAPVKLANQVVEASCGECQFGMEGSGCDLAIRIDGRSYYVDGTSMGDHDDAHGEHGMCSCVRHATVSGEVQDNRFVATSFTLLPPETSTDAEEASSVGHDSDANKH